MTLSRLKLKVIQEGFPDTVATTELAITGNAGTPQQACGGLFWGWNRLKPNSLPSFGNLEFL